MIDSVCWPAYFQICYPRRRTYFIIGSDTNQSKDMEFVAKAELRYAFYHLRGAKSWPSSWC